MRAPVSLSISLSITLVSSASLLACSPDDDPAAKPYVYADELDPTQPLASPRFSHAATLLDDGRVLVVGGILGAPSQLDLDAYVANIELFDPATEQFEQGAALASPRSAPTATRVDDGRVVVVGGMTLDSNSFSTPALAIEVWDPASESFSTVDQLPSGGMLFHCAVALPSNDLLVIDDCHPGDCTALRIDPDAGVTTLTADPSARYNLDIDCVRLPDGRVLLAGGTQIIDGLDEPVDYVEIYDPEAGGSLEQVGPMSASFGPKSELLVLDGGDVLILGDASAGGPLGQIYRSRTGEFEPVDGEVGDRVDHTLTLLEDGRVLIAGGTLADSANLDLAPGLELFDPTTGAFVSLSPSFEPRKGHAAVRLDGGPVLIVGGQDASDHRGDAYLYR